MGMNFFLSDILGTEEDVIYKDMEDEVEKRPPEERGEPLKPKGAENRGTALWSETTGRRGDDTEGGRRSYGDLTVLYFEAGEEDHDEIEKRDRKIRIEQTKRTVRIMK